MKRISGRAAASRDSGPGRKAAPRHGEQRQAALVEATGGADRRARRSDRGEDLAGVACQDLAGVGDAGGPAAAVDQRDAQLPLECGDVGADPRLRPVHLFAGCGEAPAVQDREERPQPVELHVPSMAARRGRPPR